MDQHMKESSSTENHMGLESSKTRFLLMKVHSTQALVPGRPLLHTKQGRSLKECLTKMLP